jgi:hypothetical protein
MSLASHHHTTSAALSCLWVVRVIFFVDLAPY